MKTIYYYVLTPAVCLLLCAVLILSYRGLPMEERPARLSALEDGKSGGADPEKSAGFLLLYEDRSDLVRVVEDTLGEMRYGWRSAAALTEEALSRVHTVLLCSPALRSLEGEEAVRLIRWVEGGGRLALMTAQADAGWFSIVKRKLGILESRSDYRVYNSFRLKSGALPVFDGIVLDEEVEDYALPVTLEDGCRVWMETGDAGIPLMWTRDVGQGRVLVCNHSLIQGKDARGYVLFALRALEKTLVYPILNAGLVFIDDFPAPQPEGYDEMLQKQYGYSIQGFFRNHWWPDMKTLARKFGLRYTGVLVETYNHNMTAPFEPDTEDHALIRYYASELLQSGGEIGLHGYNHQPLCLDGWQYAGEDYLTWANEKDMEGAVRELVRYGHTFLPEAVFTSYVPPSNYLSDEGQAVLMKTVPTLTAISGVYLPENGIRARVQEYRENEDGSVSVPRVTSGFSMGSYIRSIAAFELSLHGVFSHFIHPDDVLDEERGALLGWEQLRTDFDDALTDISGAYPALRWCTATEAAGAVQRYARVRVEREWEQGNLALRLAPFYDEVWLCLWSEEAPKEVSGAEVHEGGGALWLRATRDTVRVSWGDGT